MRLCLAATTKVTAKLYYETLMDGAIPALSDDIATLEDIVRVRAKVRIVVRGM